MDLNSIISKSNGNKVAAIKLIREEYDVSVTEIKNLIDLAFYLKENDSEADINSLLDKEIKQLTVYLNLEDTANINNSDKLNEKEQQIEKVFSLNRIIDDSRGNKAEAIKLIRKEYPVSISTTNNLITIALQAKAKDQDVNLDELFEKEIKDFLDSVYVEEKIIFDIDLQENQNLLTSEIKTYVDNKDDSAVVKEADMVSLLNNIFCGEINPVLICPHCQSKGHVHTKLVTKKEGISGGKVVAGIFTHGWSLLATGLSRKNEYTQAHCDNCNSTWTYK